MRARRLKSCWLETVRAWFNCYGFVQAYNAQAAVDGEAQIIVAHDVTQSGGDCGQLIPQFLVVRMPRGALRQTSRKSHFAGL